MIFLSWLLLPLAALAGVVFWTRFPVEDSAESAVEAVLAITFLSVSLLGFVGLALAELGRLTPLLLCGALGLLTAACACLRRRALGIGAWESESWLLVAVALLVAIVLAPASSDLYGGLDPGTYANAAAWLADHGQITMRLKELAEIPPETRSLFTWIPENAPVIARGFYISDWARGEVTPQFFHLFLVYLAIGKWLGGMRGLFFVVPVLGVFSTWAVMLFSRKFLGAKWAALVGLLLSLHLAQVWCARNPYSELPSQWAAFVALLGLWRARETGELRWGVLAAIGLGVCFLVRRAVTKNSCPRADMSAMKNRKKCTCLG